MQPRNLRATNIVERGFGLVAKQAYQQISYFYRRKTKIFLPPTHDFDFVPDIYWKKRIKFVR